jgi:hypothetical protein
VTGAFALPSLLADGLKTLLRISVIWVNPQCCFKISDGAGIVASSEMYKPSPKVVIRMIGIKPDCLIKVRDCRICIPLSEI